MLLTLTTTHSPATDFGYLLRKNPARSQSFSHSFGKAHVFYPEATAERCTVALLVEVDPVGLVRKRRVPSGEGGALEQYVNNRPYAASSFLSVAIAEVFGSALSGNGRERPGLADTPLPLSVKFSALPCRGGKELLRKLFEPLGYTLSARPRPLDEQFSDWGESSYFQVGLKARLRLQQLLSHLYVLVPVLDNDKHYWVGDDEVEILLRRGECWLAAHSVREAITRRYLKHQSSLIDDALSQLADESELNPDAVAEVRDGEEAALEPTVTGASNSVSARADLEIGAPSLNEQRHGSVLAALKGTGATRVLDLGCGEGKLLQALLKERQFTEIIGLDVSHRALEIAHDRLHYDRLPPVQKERLRLLHSSLIYRDQRLVDFDADAVMEVIEHLDAARLAAFERVLFECAQPKHIVITTPNSEYNVKWETLPAGRFHYRDHRFESGRGRSFRSGPTASPPASATTCASRPSARKTRRWAHRRRWGCLESRNSHVPPT